MRRLQVIGVLAVILTIGLGASPLAFADVDFADREFADLGAAGDVAEEIGQGLLLAVLPGFGLGHFRLGERGWGMAWLAADALLPAAGAHLWARTSGNTSQSRWVGAAAMIWTALHMAEIAHVIILRDGLGNDGLGNTAEPEPNVASDPTSAGGSGGDDSFVPNAFFDLPLLEVRF